MHRIIVRVSRAAAVALCALFGASAFAQVDISGTWVARYHEDQPERGPGPSLVEYYGMPINDAARKRGLAWDPSILTLLEHQCKPHPADYGSRHSHFRIWKEIDSDSQQLIAYRFRREWQAPERTIYMDGRDHPSALAPHTFQGFSTGKWEGNKLTVTTTHLKNAYIRRNGLPRSDMATLTENYIRHGDFLTVIKIVDDPVYLTEPLIQTSDYRMSLTRNIDAYPCDTVVELAGQPWGYVPHYLPGEHPFLDEFAKLHGVPLEAALGGAATMYPSFIE
jgi:hypothetical protein